ncbi:MAG: UvrB/UvrC motif-containing protein [candidate division Zixibacteria bacterium]|nr:UvrB/UvrC motif-containing protein [candidate division Zixibacteria bacterium]
MLCQDCKKREAQVHLTQIINNEKRSLSLCKECASARGFHSPLDNMPFPLADILSGMTQDFNSPNKNTDINETISCSECGMTFEEFTRQGRFGCGKCYDAFRSNLELIMRKIHGSSLHRGTVPEFGESETENSTPIPVQEEERLETELDKAIESEDFERAAEIRDKLKSLRNSTPTESK